MAVALMKQLILPPDVSEVTMQKEILTPPKAPPATRDQASTWLEEMQYRLNLCIKTKQNVHPRTIVALVNDTLSGVTQYYRTIGNVWESLYAKHQLRASNITLDRVYTMLAEFLIELKLNEEQDKIAQIVTGSSGAVKPSMYDEYVNASDDCWKPGGCSQVHHCPKYHPRRQPGRCAICGSTILLNAIDQLSLKSTRPPRVRKAKASGQSLRVNPKARTRRDR